MTENPSFDVVVIGGGPHGVTCANWIKKWRPETRIAIVDKQAATGYKVGESLLSTATRSFVASGLSMPVLRRLFGNKAGIRFWWTDPHTDALHRHVDVVDIEETFQVERRVLDLALQQTARRRGITLLTGTRVDLKKSTLDEAVKTIACEGPNGSFTLDCRMLCDASGPASVLARHLGHYRKAPERHQTFTTNAYFAYFRQKKELPLQFWDEPATRHLCFPGGWAWFINLASWERTPEANLQQMVDYLLDHAEAPDEALPSRRELQARFGASTEPVVSIGFTVRADRDAALGRMSVEEKFKHYVAAHPAIAEVMTHYELIEAPYGHKTPYHSFFNLVHDSTQYAGDGWCLVADAAAFVNPLFSPGLNLGSGSCYLAAQATVDALNRDDITRDAFAPYEAYMAAVYEAVLAETDLYYRAFDDVEAYERALMLKLVYGAADVIQRDTVFSASDPYVHDLLNPRFRARVDAARGALREGKGAAGVRAVVDPFIRDVLAQPFVQALRLDEVFTHYTADGRRMEHKRRHRPAFGFRRCECGAFVDRDLRRCPVCGKATGSARRQAA